MHIHTAIKAVCLCLGTAMVAVPAYSFDTGGNAVPTCKKGQVYSKALKKCVAQQSSGAVDDDDLYDTGRQLALAGKYDEAIRVLSRAANKSDPRVLNYLGYSYRKQGDVKRGLDYYEAALKLDPDYTLVREYLGEAHLQLGDLASARKQLAEIEKRCGTTCEEYTDLSGEIAAFLKTKG
ncbi:tetratricopeptide repeat protein [Pseudaminobacter sp. NGMCC 1.201702]|uniref:tetratricopeptide repeat protein n=1 Tax=Pseudaminobacter sp. NGMCC 1.201702 TaxID=3391825 RepID=UPI0039EFB3FB